jgi:hypothetical protein
MFILVGIPLPTGPSFATIAAELGLTAGKRPRHRARAAVPAQRSSRRESLGAAAR